MELKQIYLAAPLFNERERAWNLEVANYLRKQTGVKVFLPQIEAGNSGEKMAQATSLEEIEQIRRTIFNTDLKGLDDSQMLLMITDGVVLDPGACAEVGYMFASGKTCIALHQDSRSFISGRMNLFIEQMFTDIFDNLEDVVEFIKLPGFRGSSDEYCDYSRGSFGS